MAGDCLIQVAFRTGLTVFRTNKAFILAADFIVKDLKKAIEKKMRKKSNRKKRTIPDCEIVEVYAFIDQKEWNL